MRFDIIYNGKIKLSLFKEDAKQAGDFFKDIMAGKVPKWRYIKEEIEDEDIDLSEIKIRTTRIEHTYYNLEGDKI